jgi:hypothetical protein
LTFSEHSNLLFPWPTVLIPEYTSDDTGYFRLNLCAAVSAGSPVFLTGQALLAPFSFFWNMPIKRENPTKGAVHEIQKEPGQQARAAKPPMYALLHLFGRCRAQGMATLAVLGMCL